MQVLNRQEKSLKIANAGVGYTSIMIIFALVCLVIFAVLSLKAASSDKALNERSGEYLKEYYTADNIAKQKLCELDEIAYKAGKSGFLAETFQELAEGKDVSIKMIQNGCVADYSVPINERQELSVSVTFRLSGEYEITRWQCRTLSSANDDHLNVWDGTM